MIGNLIGAFIVILIGVTLYPTIIEQLQLASLTNPDIPIMLLNLIPIFFVLAILSVVTSVIFSSFKDFSNYSNDYEEENKYVKEEQKPHKQTYLEYVNERLKVEKLLHRS